MKFANRLQTLTSICITVHEQTSARLKLAINSFNVECYAEIPQGSFTIVVIFLNIKLTTNSSQDYEPIVD
ncbi:hypothetical protein PGB90_001057 [Kerria lacca]